MLIISFIGAVFYDAATNTYHALGPQGDNFGIVAFKTSSGGLYIKGFLAPFDSDNVP